MADSLERLRHEVEALQEELQSRAETFGESIRTIHNRVCDAIAKQPAAPEEPPALTEDEMDAYKRTPDHFCRESHKAAARLRWCEPELARLREENATLREGLKRQPDDISDSRLIEWLGQLGERTYHLSPTRNVLHEIARRRGLTVAK